MLTLEWLRFNSARITSFSKASTRSESEPDASVADDGVLAPFGRRSLAHPVVISNDWRQRERQERDGAPAVEEAKVNRGLALDKGGSTAAIQEQRSDGYPRNSQKQCSPPVEWTRVSSRKPLRFVRLAVD